MSGAYHKVEFSDSTKMRIARMHRRDGLDYAEIGRRLGVSPHTAKKLVTEGQSLLDDSLVD